MTGALEGIKVLDLSRLLPGGFCSLLMADAGADVVKVEDTGMGDYVRWAPPLYGDDSHQALGTRSALYLSLNRGKRSIRLDLKSDAGREAFLRLAKDADVVLESFRPGVLDRLGVGYEVLKDVNPGIVVCAISGYGATGPNVARAGHDTNYLALGGVLGLTGAKDGPPVSSAGQIADLGGGGLMAVFGILAALWRRERTGEGQFVDVSMTDGAQSWLAMVAGQFLCDGNLPTRGTGMLNGGVACYLPYECSDGWVSVGALEPKFWQAFCAGAERPDLLEHQFAPPGSEGHGQIAEVFTGLPSTTAAAAGLLVVTIVLVALGVLARRRDDRTGLAAVAVSLAALGAGLLTAAEMPVGVLGIAPHQLRWLWPLSLFLTFAMLAVVSGLVRRELAVGVSLTAVVVLAVAAIPYSNAGAGPTLSTFAHPLVRDLADQLRIADLEGPVLFEYGNQALFEPFSASVQDQLDRLGIEFRAADAATIRQMGDARGADGDESTLVTLRYGAAAFDPVDGVEPIVFASTLEPGDREELARLERQVIDLVTTKGVALSERGQERREAGWLGGGTGPGGAFVDADAVVGGVLARAYAAGSVQVDPGDEALIGRWADLVLRLADETVAVYALPIADG